jgi:hypothetical protein
VAILGYVRTLSDEESQVFDRHSEALTLSGWNATKWVRPCDSDSPEEHGSPVGLRVSGRSHGLKPRRRKATQAAASAFQ